jgi:hypothetical protein
MSDLDDTVASTSLTVTTQSDGPTIFSLEDKILVFPKGVVDFAAKMGVEVLEIDTDGDMLGYNPTTREWVGLPPANEDDEKPVSVVSPFKKRGE